MKLFIFFCALIFFAENADCRKGGGGGRVGGKGGWFWKSSSRKSSSSSNRKHTPPHSEPSPKQPQPSAPHPEPSLKKETAGVQQSSFQKNAQSPQTPVGWNVPGTNQNSPWKGTGNNQPGSGYNGYPQQSGGAWGGASHAAPGGAWGNGYHGAPGGYHGATGGAWGNGYQGMSGGHNGFSSGYPQSSFGGYGGYHPSPGGFGGGGFGGGGYGGGGFGGGGFGGGGYGGRSGMMGGYGGMGGFGGPMMVKQRSGFGSTFGNILTGMAIYSLGSSLIGGAFKKPYTVHNYYNQNPNQTHEEIKMPSNILTMCEGDSTSFCIKGTTAICTTNGTVLCVATMSNASPCGENGALCVNTTVPCVDKNDPMCQNLTQQQEDVSVNLPCFTNLTVDANLLNETGPVGENHKYCVTTMAIAGPEYKHCPEDGTKKIDGYRSVLAGNFSWSIIVGNMKRPYIVYNFQHPTEASAGEIVMPLPVLAPCIENATNLCAPGLFPVCTTFAEVMCLEVASSAQYCEEMETACFKSTIPCTEDDILCQNATSSSEEEETSNTNDVILDLPCFANITINTNLPNFDIHNYNGTIPQGSATSFMYHYHFCLVTLALPNSEKDVCLIEGGKTN